MATNAQLEARLKELEKEGDDLLEKYSELNTRLTQYDNYFRAGKWTAFIIFGLGSFAMWVLNFIKGLNNVG
jgi:hypothetical protein